MTKRTKIYVEGRYNGGEVVAVTAEDHGSNHYTMTRRQYEHAVTRLGLADGDGLRLAPVGNNDVGAVVVYDGSREWAIVS